MSQTAQRSPHILVKNIKGLFNVKILQRHKCSTSTAASGVTMHIAEITNTSKPKSPQQQRITTLQQQAKRRQQAAKQERLRQQQQKLNQQRAELNKP